MSCLINSISQLPYPFVESRVLIADLCSISGKDDSPDLGVVLSQAFQFLFHARLPSDLFFLSSSIASPASLSLAELLTTATNLIIKELTATLSKSIHDDSNNSLQ
ncbi:hypothetical protein M5K25_011582 [Dendrobium thyrsiflorum]|uniref:Uncharacterized protein n=1 Tax=Dendrobium thyrsiflorum TaxID=117978 RepID=A0ABD0V353_DENTH